MTWSTLGERFALTVFGESHGHSIGCVISGCPAGVSITTKEIQKELDLRKPGTSKLTTQRKEQDKVEILSGIFNDRTTGSPICMTIKNKDTRSEDYANIMKAPRPGHAEFTAWEKYGGFNDYRGGGHFSARLTACFVMGGVIAKKLLKTSFNTDIVAYVKEIGNLKSSSDFKSAKKNRYSTDVRCPDPVIAKKMSNAILKARKSGDSLGGIIECQIINVPVGLGEPIFSALDSDISRAMFSIPAVKGVEFGKGFESAKLFGSENNDQYSVSKKKVSTRTNNSGGILGGISNGMPIEFRLAFKPPSSILKKQSSFNLKSKKSETLVVKGRHDPCVLPRAVPIVESVAALVLADHGLRSGKINPIIK